VPVCTQFKAMPPQPVVPLRPAVILVLAAAVLGCLGGFVLGAADGSMRGLVGWVTTLVAALAGGALLRGSPLFLGNAARGSGFRYTGTAATAAEAAAQQAERAKDWARLHEAASAFEAGADTARSLAWVNAAFARLWPSLEQAACASIHRAVQPMLDRPASLPPFVTRMELSSNLSLGPRPPVVTGVEVMEDDGDGKAPTSAGPWPAPRRLRIELDVEAGLHPSAVLGLWRNALCVPLVLHSLSITGTIALIFDPLMGAWPSFAALSIAFVRPPAVSLSVRIDANSEPNDPSDAEAAEAPASDGGIGSGIGSDWLELDLMSVPVLSEWLHGLLDEILSERMVLPNAITKPDWRGWLAAGAGAAMVEAQRKRCAAWSRVHRSLSSSPGASAPAASPKLRRPSRRRAAPGAGGEAGASPVAAQREVRRRASRVLEKVLGELGELDPSSEILPAGAKVPVRSGAAAAAESGEGPGSMQGMKGAVLGAAATTAGDAADMAAADEFAGDSASESCPSEDVHSSDSDDTLPALGLEQFRFNRAPSDDETSRPAGGWAGSGNASPGSAGTGEHARSHAESDEMYDNDDIADEELMSGAVGDEYADAEAFWTCGVAVHRAIGLPMPVSHASAVLGALQAKLYYVRASIQGSKETSRERRSEASGANAHAAPAGSSASGPSLLDASWETEAAADEAAAEVVRADGAHSNTDLRADVPVLHMALRDGESSLLLEVMSESLVGADELLGSVLVDLAPVHTSASGDATGDGEMHEDDDAQHVEGAEARATNAGDDASLARADGCVGDAAVALAAAGAVAARCGSRTWYPLQPPPRANYDGDAHAQGHGRLCVTLLYDQRDALASAAAQRGARQRELELRRAARFAAGAAAGAEARAAEAAAAARVEQREAALHALASPAPHPMLADEATETSQQPGQVAKLEAESSVAVVSALNFDGADEGKTQNGAAPHKQAAGTGVNTGEATMAGGKESQDSADDWAAQRPVPPADSKGQPLTPPTPEPQGSAAEKLHADVDASVADAPALPSEPMAAVLDPATLAQREQELVAFYQQHDPVSRLCDDVDALSPLGQCEPRVSHNCRLLALSCVSCAQARVTAIVQLGSPSATLQQTVRHMFESSTFAEVAEHLMAK